MVMMGIISYYSNFFTSGIPFIIYIYYIGTGGGILKPLVTDFMPVLQMRTDKNTQYVGSEKGQNVPIRIQQKKVLIKPNADPLLVTRDAPHSDFAGYPVQAGYRISGRIFNSTFNI
jgi:hypothetical protein